MTCRSASGGSMEQVFPIAKMAELKKLKTGSGDRHVLGAEISSVGVSGGILVKLIQWGKYLVRVDVPFVFVGFFLDGGVIVVRWSWVW